MQPWTRAATGLVACCASAIGSSLLNQELAECQGLYRKVVVRVGLTGELLPAPFPTEGEVESQDCNLIWVAHDDLGTVDVKDLLHQHDYLLTDSADHVAIGSRLDRIIFFDAVPEFHAPEDPDALLHGKTTFLSVLLPRADSLAWRDATTHEIHRQAMLFLPEHTYFDDGTEKSWEAAFAKYRFTLIVDDDQSSVSAAFVHSFAFHAVPLFNGYTQFGAMFHRAVLPFNRTHFSLELLRANLPDINFDVGWLWNYHRMLQDQLNYRYGTPWEMRLARAACQLCRLDRAPLVFAGVYSAKANFEKRQAVRDTWGSLLKGNLRFFLGSLSPDATQDDERARREQAEHGDLVVLDVAEGYALNARKGWLFLRWAALHVSAEFLLKVDDDVALNPEPLLDILVARPPFGYIWGYFDYISPVPDDGPFRNDGYPYNQFPPYPRGVVRAMSMDLVRHLAARPLERIFGDDPSLGVSLRLLVLDGHAVTLDDRESYRAFAMEPSCSPTLWSHYTNRTWITHHVTAEQIRCLWRASHNASCECLATGPLAAGFLNRTDKINASRTYQLWGDPDADLDE